MSKVKLLLEVLDNETKQNLPKGTVKDFGKDRNELAVNNGWAEWVDEKEPAKSEKKETPKKKVTAGAVVKGEKIESK